VFDIHHTPFSVIFFLFDNLNVGNVARDDKGDEEDHAVDAGYSFAFGADIGDEDVLKDGLFLSFAHFHFVLDVLALSTKSVGFVNPIGDGRVNQSMMAF